MCHHLDVGSFRYVLFLAVGFSLSVYLYRGYRRWVAPPKHEDLGGLDPSTSGRASTAGSPAVPTLPTEKPAKAPRQLGFTKPSMTPTEPPAGTGSESLVQAVIREELARKRAEEGGEPVPSASPNAGRAGLFASGEPRTERVSVAAALTGVRLPDDLVPLVGNDTSADPHLVTFVAPRLPAADVGRALGDELERLGYRVESESDIVAVATKGAAVLRVTLYPDAANERIDGIRRFPTAPASSVVVEFAS